MDDHDTIGASEDGKGSFWKKNNRAVPGRPSPRKEVKAVNSYNPSASSSFQDFQQSISDAWDLGDDEFCNISNLKISKKVSQTAAENVINIHKYKSNEVGSKKKVSQTDKDHGSSKMDSEKGNSKSNKGSFEVSELNLQLSGFHFAKEKIAKFKNLLESSLLNLSELQNLSWPGIPFPVKADTWRLLAGYTPTCLELRENTLKKKRSEYWFYVSQYYETEARDDLYQGTYRQIHIDIPRMSPTISLLRQPTVQKMFERILFIWAVRHPASGYVQGINDLVTPFFIVFLHQVLSEGTDLDNVDVSVDVTAEDQSNVEADSYWCFCKFLDGIQDNYIFPQLGIQHKINQLKELIQRLDGVLHNHLEKNGVEYLQFSFRWMNNLLTRELPLRCLIRLWDTYLAELDTFASFQLFVCAAFLLHWRQEVLMEKDFQGLMLFLQNLPTQNWNDSDVSLLVAEAYKLKCTFADAPNHFQSKGS